MVADSLQCWVYRLFGNPATSQLGIQASARGMKGWLKIYECLLPLANGDIDRWDDFVRAFKTSTPEGKTFLKETLEGVAEETPENILAQGLKVSNKIKDVYPTMYHYANDITLLDRADDMVDGVEGVWMLREHTAGKRFVTPENLLSQVDANSKLQLPLQELAPGQFVPDPTKGRFKCEFRTVDVADDFRIPQAEVHSTTSGPGLKDWLQSVTRDNPHLGQGGAVQYTQGRAVVVTVTDLVTGQVVRNKAHLRQLLQQ